MDVDTGKLLMKNRVAYIGIGILAFSITSSVYSVKKKILVKDLPAPVAQTVSELGKSATLKQVVTELDKGKTVYEAQLVANGYKRDVSIGADGSILETEEVINLADVPASVRTAIEKAAGTGKITRVEKVTAADHPVIYEASVGTGPKKSEVRVDSQGSLLPPD